MWTYRLYSNGVLYFEPVQQGLEGAGDDALSGPGKDPVMVAAGKKAAVTRATGSYTFDQHIEGKPAAMRDMALAVNDYVISLHSQIEVAPKKLYVAYRISQNFLCMEVQKKQVLLYLKLDPKKVAGPKGISRDVTNIGHFGTGDLEITLSTLQNLEAAKPFIDIAYLKVGA